MKFTYILLIVLTALALHLAWTGVVAPAVAGGNAGAGGGDVHARVLEPTLAGSKPGVALGSNEALAGGRGGMTGECCTLAGAKPGIAGGDSSAIAGGRGGMTGEF